LRIWTPVIWLVPLGPVVEALVKPPYDLGEEDNAPTKAGQEQCAVRRCEDSRQARRKEGPHARRIPARIEHQSGDYSGGRPSLFRSSFKPSVHRCGSIFPILVETVFKGNSNPELLS